MRDEKMKANFDYFDKIKIKITAAKVIERAFIRYLNNKMKIVKQIEIVHHGLISKFAKTYLEKGLDESKFSSKHHRDSVSRDIRLLDHSRNSPKLPKKKKLKLFQARNFHSVNDQFTGANRSRFRLSSELIRNPSILK